MPTFSEEKFEGHEYRIDVQTDGTWIAHVSTMDGQMFRALTLQELNTKVRAAVRRANAKLGIKATIIGIRKKGKGGWSDDDDPSTWPTETRDVIIRGYDERKRSILYEVDGQKMKGHNGGGGSTSSGRLSELGLMRFDIEGTFTKRLTKEQAQRFTDLVIARQRADRELVAFAEEYRIGNVEKFVENEIARIAAARETAEPANEDPRVSPPKKRGRK